MKKTIAVIMLFAALPIMVYSQAGYFIDNLRNTSNLSDDEIEQYLRNGKRAELVGLLDRNKDGIADGTRKNVREFIARMEIIIICRKERLEQLRRLHVLEGRATSDGGLIDI